MDVAPEVAKPVVAEPGSAASEVVVTLTAEGEFGTGGVDDSVAGFGPVVGSAEELGAIAAGVA